MPLPLGLNVIRRDLDTRFGEGTCERLSKLLSESVEYAITHEAESREFLRIRGEGRPEWNDDALVKKYLAMYVSPLTRSMGDKGRSALHHLLTEGHKAGLCPDPGTIDVI